MNSGIRYVTQDEVTAAVKQTKIDLFELAKEIGQNEFFEIFDEYSPEEDDQPPYILFESLFGEIAHDNFEQFILSGEYLLGVWKRCKARLNLIMDGSQPNCRGIEGRNQL